MSSHSSAASPVWIAIFSFNRGEFLQHCVASVEHCMPFAHILIVDDNSTDPQTQTVLADLRLRHDVLQPGDEAPQSKHGGLYANMQRALDHLPPDAILCTLQDDMQVVRPVSAAEFHVLEQDWRATPQACFIHPAFFKGSERQRNGLTLHQNGRYYINQRRNSSVGAWYSDIFIAPVARLREHRWQFGGRESANEALARTLFEPMGHLINPFIAWLPAAPCWRGKRRTWAIRQGERRHRCGFHPFLQMTVQQSAAFCARAVSDMPYAEDYLQLQTDILSRPWVYHPLQGSRWLKWMNSLELKWVPVGRTSTSEFTSGT